LVLKTAHPFSNALATEPSTPGVQVLGFATRHAQIWVRSSIEFLVPEEKRRKGEKEKRRKGEKEKRRKGEKEKSKDQCEKTTG